MASGDMKPYIPPEKSLPEITIKAIILGVILAIVLGAANVYLGLYAGMTVCASIPAAVISMAVLMGGEVFFKYTFPIFSIAFHSLFIFTRSSS